MWIEEMILEDGRPMTITVPGSPTDPAEPWRGNDPGTPVAAIGIFVQHAMAAITGDHIKRGDQKVLIAPTAAVDVSKGTKITDSLDDSDWMVEKVAKITTESDILLYILAVKQ